MKHSDDLIIQFFPAIRQIIKQNVGPLIIAQLVAFAINFLQTIYLARVLAPDNFGVINYSLTVLGFALIFTNLGISNMGTRELVVKGTYDSLLYCNATVIRIILAFFFILGVMPWLFLSGQTNSIFIISLIYFCSLIPLIMIPDWVFNGLDMMKANSLVKLLIALSGLILILIFVKNPNDLIFVPITYLISILIGLSVGVWILKKESIQIHFQINPGTWIQYIKKSLNLGISSYIIAAFATIDIIIVGTILPSSDVGYYSGASKLILAIHTLLTLVTTGIYPSVINIMKQQSQVMKTISPHVITLLLIIQIPLCMIISINSDIIIPLLYGSQYNSTIPVLCILIWEIIPFSFYLLYSVILNASFRESLIMKILILQMILQIPFMILFTTIIGITGTAISIILIGSLTSIIYFYFFKDEIPFPVKNAGLILFFTILTLGSYHGLFLINSDLHEIVIFRFFPIVLFLLVVFALRLITVKKILYLIREPV